MYIEEIKNAPALYDKYSFMLKCYLTDNNYSINNGLNFHPDISKEIIEEIVKLTKKLNEFISIRLSYIEGNYYNNSFGKCYVLSSLLCFSTDDWILHQGMLDYKGKPFKHSWLEKGNIVYDPAFNLITFKELYDYFFITTNSYNNEEARNLFERTNIFLFYEDIENPELKSKYEFDTIFTKIKAYFFLSDLDDFLEDYNLKSYQKR